MICQICEENAEQLFTCEFCGSEGCSRCVDIKIGLCKKCKNKA